MKLTNNSLYLDYNATAPLANSVKNWLAKGDFVFGNPSSAHSEGLKAKQQVNQAKAYLLEHFGLAQTHEVVFHSGASEGINALFQATALCCFESKRQALFGFSKTDHSSMVNQRKRLQSLGHSCIEFDVNSQGELQVTSVIEQLNQAIKAQPCLINFTHVNNETGVVWPLEQALEIKQQTGCRIHVDAVQAVGKTANYRRLLPEIDYYTFSGHKFGALKGVGFSFIKLEAPYPAFILGGGQQNDRRSGTENVLAIQSLALALDELAANYDFFEVNKATRNFEQRLVQLIHSKGSIAGAQAKHRNATTINMVLPGQPANKLLTAFDLSGVQLSSGSACSSGSVLPSRVLMAMGAKSEEAKCALRFSFSPYLKKSQVDSIYPRIEKILKRFV